MHNVKHINTLYEKLLFCFVLSRSCIVGPGFDIWRRRFIVVFGSFTDGIVASLVDAIVSRRFMSALERRHHPGKTFSLKFFVSQTFLGQTGVQSSC